MPITNNTSGQSVSTTQVSAITGNITAWNSIVTITSAFDTTQTLPQCILADIGKSIIITNNGVGLVTIDAFAGDTLENSRVLAQGEAITIIVTALNLSRVISDTVATPIITEALAPWTAITAINTSAQRSTTILGVLTGISNNLARTTTATFNATEAVFWTYISQSSVPAFIGANLVLAGFQITESGQTFQSNTTRITGLTFDTTEQLSWTALSSSSTGTRVSLSNFATNTSIGLASATVNSATVIAFVQTTAGITVTIPSPTNVNVHKTITFENLTTATQPITIRGVAGGTDTIVLGIGDVKEMSWNGNGWRATSTVNVLAENGSISVPVFTTLTTPSDIAGTSFTLPSAGKWQVIFTVPYLVPSGSFFDIAFTDASNVQVGQAARVSTSGANSLGVAPLQAHIITTGSATYKVRITNGNAGISLPYTPATITYNKISGFTPVTGQTVDYSNVKRSSTSALTNLFTVTSPNTSNWNTVVPSTGRIPLTGATVGGNLVVNTITNNTIIITKTAIYTGVFSCVVSNSLGNVTHFGQVVKNGSTVIAVSSSANVTGSSVLDISVPFTEPLVAGDTLDFRIGTASAGTIGVGSYSLDIKQLGSSATTGLSLNLTTTGIGASTYNSATSTLNIPLVDPISKTKALLQGFGVGNNILLHGMNLSSPFYVEVVLRDQSNGSVIPCSIVSVTNTAITINSTAPLASGRLSIIEIKP